jgi:hypothetical protein
MRGESGKTVNMGVPIGAERRQFGRRLTCVHAVIRMRGRPDITCTVRNVSEGGALLQVPRPAWLPSRFELFVEANKSARQCEIVHRGEITVGVRFTEGGQQPVTG